MKIETTPRGKATIIKVSGRMDAAGAPEFEKACENCIRNGVFHLVLVADLAALDYVSSAGLRSFLIAAKALQSNGGNMYLCGMRGLVKEVFDMTRLTSLFPVFDTPESALSSL